ncbi:efflux RND transporter periplasmic adaptor subunit [Thiohalobacter sp. IOR34]|uniref:efflux RND transporter periplasmic adaptor subunit n=1 Tax=Thiohalobacter sp. IOR34 TaxID=3057176 RepID=UPI0025AF298E|nr:efflux RND transporter periplasmic adaptor subunit [Thiohalobacter sp. IOR34]WJW75653.1 efflux RND transporter periplasmic adaptor subunit [Thiohalobacter sp. IOR34]
MAQCPRPTIPSLLLAALATAALLLAGCQPEAPSAPATAKARPHWVEVAAVVERSERRPFTRPGTLRARRLVRLHNQEEGLIREIAVYEGDRVRAGQLLIRFDDALLRAELDKARATLRQAEQDLARIRGLAEKNLVSAEERLQAETALRVARAELRLLETRLGYMQIHAPFAGLIAERRVEPGDAVPSFTHLLTLIDPASLVAELTVSELRLAEIAPGDPAELRIDALGEARFPGRVRRIHPTIDPATRQGVIEVALEPVPAGARAGQLCRVTLAGKPRHRLLLPLAALRRDARGEYVYRLDAGQRVRRQAVRTGLALGEEIELLEGLTAGQQVVIRGFLGLRDGKAVEVVTAAERQGDAG